jgi:hypothetical protein
VVLAVVVEIVVVVVVVMSGNTWATGATGAGMKDVPIGRTGGTTVFGIAPSPMILTSGTSAFTDGIDIKDAMNTAVTNAVASLNRTGRWIGKSVRIVMG